MSELSSEKLSMTDAEVLFYPDFFSSEDSAAYFEELSKNINWKQESARFPGGLVPLPRLTAWYGDEGKIYRYSGIKVHPEAWTPLLLAIKKRVETAAELNFNSVLLNFYRNQNDSVSWHSDDEPELGENPVIASVTFGAMRAFQFKHKTIPDLRAKVDLTPGSLLLMCGTTQHYWKHQVPKSKKAHDARINLTFRVIKG